MTTPPTSSSSTSASGQSSVSGAVTAAVALAPRLAPPGAGLPLVELWIARLIFRAGARTTSRRAAAEAITRERDAILALVRGLEPARAARPVLIKRLRGLEDSSRHWSVYMTLAHLRIVNHAIHGTMTALLAGRRQAGAASTAAVKPEANAGAEEVASFERACEELLELERASPSFKTEQRYAHPWFGPLAAADWFFMAGFHLALHRKQIEAILAGGPQR